MQWQDEGIILSVRKFSERDATISLLSREHGCYRSVVKGAFTKPKRGICQSGNLVSAHWNARLPEHMGTLQCELIRPVAALLLNDPLRLACMGSLTTLLDTALAERDPHPALYRETAAFLSGLSDIYPHRPEQNPQFDWLANYVRLELFLLQEMGFGLDLSVCAATGRREDLCYVSPKTGRAVTREAGAPYQEKLLPLPSFLLDGSAPDPVEILDGLRLCGYFFEHRLLASRERKMPAARVRYVDMQRRQEIIAD